MSREWRPFSGSISPFRPLFLRLLALLRNRGRYFAAGVAIVDTGGEFVPPIGERGNSFAEYPSLPSFRLVGGQRGFATSVIVGFGPTSATSHRSSSTPCRSAPTGRAPPSSRPSPSCGTSTPAGNVGCHRR